MSVGRRFIAILSADRQGYSRLMAEDEIGTVRTLTAHRTVMRETIERFHDRVVDSAADNLLAEFANVVNAVECALGERPLLTALRHGQYSPVHSQREKG